MARSMHPALIAVVTAVICLAGGFLAGRWTASPPASPLDLAAGPREWEKERRSLVGKLESLEQERDSLQARIDELESGTFDRTRVPPESGSTRPASAAKPAESQEEALRSERRDPQRAKEILVELRTALENGNAQDVAELAPALEVQRELVTEQLATMLDSADSLFAMEKLAELLGETKDPRALPALQDLLKREDDDAVRTAAIRALGNVPDATSVPLLSAEFARPAGSPMPPSIAATSLGSIGTPEAIEALKKEISQGKNRMVRNFALRALSGRKDASLVDFYFAQLKRGDGVSDRFRKTAIEAIAGTGDRSAIGRLERIAFSRESSRALKEAAKRAINRLAGKRIYDVR
ncbi:MAG: HEAT repeat domain-containing protein [Planctomycetota bacterium]